MNATLQQGTYQLQLPPGRYRLTVSHLAHIELIESEFDRGEPIVRIGTDGNFSAIWDFSKGQWDEHPTP